MKLQHVFALTLVLFCASTSFSRGTESGGGGDVVLCYKSREIRDQVVSALSKSNSPFSSVDLKLQDLQPGFKPQLLDLYEARKISGFPTAPENLKILDRSAEDIYAELKKISQLPGNKDRYVGIAITRFLGSLSKPEQWVAEPLGVAEIDDATFSGKIPATCVVVQLAFYNDKSRLIHYDARVIPMMDMADKMALIVHEDIYAFHRAFLSKLQKHLEETDERAARDYRFVRTEDYYTVKKYIAKNSRTSDKVRPLIGELFSTKKISKKSVLRLLDLIYWNTSEEDYIAIP